MCHTWVDVVVGFRLAVRLEGFFSSYSGLLPPRKPTSSNSKSIRTNFLARTEKFDKSADAFDQDRSSLSWTSLCHGSFVTINKWTKNIFCNVLVITLEYVHYVWIVLTAVPKHNIRVFIIWQAPRAGKMTQIARCDWLPGRAEWSHLAHSELPAVSSMNNFPESHIINPIFRVFMDRDEDSHLVSNPYIFN